VTFVYVINKHGRPLMPTSPAKARLLLKAGKAKVVERVPFTIQLLYGSSGYTQKVYVGEDPGKTIGAGAVREDGQVLFRAEAACRPDISEKLAARRALRRSRRNRKTRYRKARPHRTKPEGWLAPSIRQLLHEHETVLALIRRILPVTAEAVEVNRFDFQRIENPGIRGKEYQEGALKGRFDVREYVLERDGYRCVLCGSDAGLEAHHLTWRFRGGSDRPKNRVTLCEECHRTITLREDPERAAKLEALIPASYRWAARVNIARQAFLARPNTLVVTGKQTRDARETLNLPKSHANDALAVIYAAFGIVPKGEAASFKGRFVRRKNRSLHRANPRQGGVRPQANANRFVLNRAGVRIMKGDLVRAAVTGIIGYVSTIRTKGALRIEDAFGNELANVSPNRVVKLADAQAIRWDIQNKEVRAASSPA